MSCGSTTLIVPALAAISVDAPDAKWVPLLKKIAWLSDSYFPVHVRVEKVIGIDRSRLGREVVHAGSSGGVEGTGRL